MAGRGEVSGQKSLTKQRKSFGARREDNTGAKGKEEHSPEVWKVGRAAVTATFVQGESLWTPGDTSAMV